MGMADSRVNRALGIGVNNLLQSDLAESLDAMKELNILSLAHDHRDCVVHVEGDGGYYPAGEPVARVTLSADNVLTRAALTPGDVHG